jgi:hypothetical protein
MKNLFYLLFFTGFISCNTDKSVTVENPSDFLRSEMVEIPVTQLETLPKDKTYLVYNQQGENIPSQITFDGKLIFQTSLQPEETVQYTIKIGTPVEFVPKTYGRLITERYDDFAWENDRVAFRIYGLALLDIDGPSNGLDLWFKRTNNLIVDKWYKEEEDGIKSYHTDAGEGFDNYNVGHSLGAGMMAPFINDSLVLNENFISQEILENGPLRTTFVLKYKDITVNGKSFSESRTFSIDAGSQMTKVIQQYGTTDVITVAAGIVKRNEEDEAFSAYTDYGTAAVLYEEFTKEENGKIFVGMVFPQGVENVKSFTYTYLNPKTNNEDKYFHVLAIKSYNPDNPITYYTGYGWDKFGFPTISDFQNYISYFSMALVQPLVIKFS